MATIHLEINGRAHTVDVPPDMPLLWVLRDVLNLTGTKYGCGVGVCGSCVVHVDGHKEQSCHFSAERADGTKITTIEGLSPDGTHPLQEAWQALDVPQCGYCQPGQIMQAAALLSRKPSPTDADIDGVMIDNVCRCGTYQRIRAAIHHAAEAGGHRGGVDRPSALAAAALAGGILADRPNGEGAATERDRPRGVDRPSAIDDTAASSCAGDGTCDGRSNELRPRDLTRRAVIKTGVAFQLSVVMGGLDLLPRFVNVSRHKAASTTALADDTPLPLSAWIQVAPDDSVTITVSRSEMGQGVRTSMAMIVAEELDADWGNVRIAQGQADAARYGSQLTVGSMSTRTMWDTLRKAGATARAMLVAAAAESWGVPAADCRTEAGAVVHPATGRRTTYGALAALAAAQPVPPPATVALKDAGQFRIIGTPMLRVDNAAVVNGTAVYGMDVRRPGMLHAVVARPPVFGGSFNAVDDTAARAVPGVRHVVTIPSGVAVVADTTWAALQGRDALRLTLDAGPNAQLDDAGVHSALVAALKPLPDLPTDAVHRLEAQYDLPYLAHATMEPMNCVAEVANGRCELWAPTQDPGGLQKAVAGALGQESTTVTVNVTLMGGGFGRRAASDFGIEAALVAKAVGAPVLLTWTRADDMQHDLYRPASVHTLRAAIDERGEIKAWQHSAVLAINGGGGTSPQQVRPLYAVPTPDIQLAAARLPVPTGFWRSVGLTQLAFSNESFLDEVAAAAGKDPVALRRALLEHDRLVGVLERAVAESGWGRPLPAGEGRGIALVDDFGAFAAVVVHVHVTHDGAVTVRRVTAAVDCGRVVNPLSAEAQVQGGVIDGLSTALMATITLSGGRVQQSHYNDYKWMRMPDVPIVDVHLIDSQESPTGLGEVGVPAAAPAVANAIFAATGRRIRHLPIVAADLAGWTPPATPDPHPTAVPTHGANDHRIYLPQLKNR
ncbi:MAG: molybdopterin-dependent oxidoreductase [Ardenticatenales bacterium]|nr:molybdopterin-dependent oxidoreductase [Ardenticatenales bacterium]